MLFLQSFGSPRLAELEAWQCGCAQRITHVVADCFAKATVPSFVTTNVAVYGPLHMRFQPMFDVK